MVFFLLDLGFGMPGSIRGESTSSIRLRHEGGAVALIRSIVRTHRLLEAGRAIPDAMQEIHPFVPDRLARVELTMRGGAHRLLRDHPFSSAHGIDSVSERPSSRQWQP